MMLARLANRSVDLCFWPGSDALWARLGRGRVRCLLFHRVAEWGEVPFLDAFGAPPIPPVQLRDLLRRMQRTGARFLTFADLHAGAWPEASELGVVISFDDGFRVDYERGLALVAEVGGRGVVFQATAMVGTDRLIWEHLLYFWTADVDRRQRFVRRLADAGLDARGEPGGLVARLRDGLDPPAVRVLHRVLDQMPEVEETAALAGTLYPTAELLRQAVADGHEVGSHGHEHLPRHAIDRATFAAELARSRAVLAPLCGSDLAFSYPFAQVADDDRSLCAEHFRQAAVVDGGWIARNADPYRLSRQTWRGARPGSWRERRWLWTGTT